jgi:hypothetical protein
MDKHEVFDLTVKQVAGGPRTDDVQQLPTKNHVQECLPLTLDSASCKMSLLNTPKLSGLIYEKWPIFVLTNRIKKLCSNVPSFI